ncbi:MAG: hypothetical protein K8S56_09915, partial [Candidatus Cloacimonetes bacterium]|nr:hypothetical protein [Candidatus Cloacimonadota bacterium]
ILIETDIDKTELITRYRREITTLRSSLDSLTTELNKYRQMNTDQQIMRLDRFIGLVNNLKYVEYLYFERNEIKLTWQSERTAREFKQYALDDWNGNIYITPIIDTNPLGPELGRHFSNNMELAQARALTTKEYFTSQLRLPEKKMKTVTARSRKSAFEERAVTLSLFPAN